MWLEALLLDSSAMVVATILDSSAISRMIAAVFSPEIKPFSIESGRKFFFSSSYKKKKKGFMFIL